MTLPQLSIPRFRAVRATTMPSICSVAIGLLSVFTQSPALADAPRPGVRGALAAALQAAELRGFAGEVLVADTTDIWFEQAVGLAQRQPLRPHRLGAVWRWGSVSKQVITTLAMNLADARLLDPDDTVAQRLPEFRSPLAERLTVRQLMQHRSGLPQPDVSTAAADGVPAFYRRQGPGSGAEGMAFCAGPPAGEPGGRFEYNNCDTLVLGALLERASGQPLPALLRQRLGMKGPRLAEGRGRAKAVAYGTDSQAVPQPVLEAFGAAGALEGTTAELLAFDRALLAGRLVSKDGLAQLWAGDPRLGYAALGVWAYPARPAGCAEAVTVIERRGNVGGIQARNLLVPSRQLSLIAFTNAADFDFGEVWEGRGFTHDLLSAALCNG